MNLERLLQFLALARRHLFASICAVVASASLVTAGFWWLGIQNLRNQHELKGKQNSVMLSLLKTGPVLKTELADVRAVTQRLDQNLVDEDELGDNDTYFRSMADRARVRLDELQQLSSPSLEEDDLYKRVPFTLRLSGSYAQVQSVLHAIETGPRLANVTALNIVRNNAGGMDLTLELNVELLAKK
jgi:Tfp pilus assembly protein PilO